MLKLVRTTALNPDFIKLVNALDKDLAIRDGDDHAFYHQFNKIDSIKNALIIYLDGQAVACGAFKEFDSGVAEVKRMYTLPSARKKGLASKILKNLESWALELGFKKFILETGKKQPEAIALYKNNGYLPISNYGPYKQVKNSVCFAKFISLTKE